MTPGTVTTSGSSCLSTVSVPEEARSRATLMQHKHTSRQPRYTATHTDTHTHTKNFKSPPATSAHPAACQAYEAAGYTQGGEGVAVPQGVQPRQLRVLPQGPLVLLHTWLMDAREKGGRRH